MDFRQTPRQRYEVYNETHWSILVLIQKNCHPILSLISHNSHRMKSEKAFRKFTHKNTHLEKCHFFAKDKALLHQTLKCMFWGLYGEQEIKPEGLLP